MPEKNLVILGGGFAGLSALDRLSRAAKDLGPDRKIVLIDSKDDSEFLPMLPDIVSGRVRPDALKIDLARRCGLRGAAFIKGTAEAVRSGKKEVIVDGRTIPYEYLVVATGAENRFFGMDKLKERCHKVYSCADASALNKELRDRASAGDVNVVIAGGGYTGLEIATNIRVLSDRLKRDFRIIILEKADDILLMTQEWMRASARRWLKKASVEVRCGESLEDVNDEGAVLSTGEVIERAVCVWSAGVKSADILPGEDLRREKTRVKVDKYLRPEGGDHENIFVAGDSAAFIPPGKEDPIRMAVMFSLGQGKIAADNVIRSVKAMELAEYRYNDLGYLIPLAGGQAPGIVLGMRVDGLFGFIMHYIMCLYRSTFGNKIAIVRSWMRNR